MSDSEPEATVATSRIEKAKKPRAPMTDTQKAVLAKGRAKLAEQRQAVKARVLEIEEDPINNVNAPKKGKKPQRVIVEDESSDSEPEIHVVRRRRPKKEKKVVYESESEEDEEEEDVPVVAKKAPLRRRTQAAPREPAGEPPFTVQFF